MGEAVRLALSATKRTAFPEAVTLNMYPERDPTDPEAPMALIARPGLEAFATVGTAPIRALHQKSGLFGDAAIVIASGEVIAVSADGSKVTYTGVTIAGDDLVDIDSALDADGNSIARVTNGTALYLINGTTQTVVEETFPGSAPSSVAHISGYWLVQDDQDFFYYQEPASTTWNALQFAAAEYKPDYGVAIRTVGEFIVFLNAASTEVWRLTGDATNPLEPYGGLKFDFGCRSRPAAVNCEGTLIWPDDKGRVWAFDGGRPKLISDNGLTEQILNTPAMDLRASYFVMQGHVLDVLTLGTAATWVYDLTTQAWVRFNSLTYDYWRAHLHCNLGGSVIAADDLSNQIWRLDPDRKLDDTTVFDREWCAFVPAKDGPVPMASIEVQGEVGDAPLEGEGSDPKVVLQISHDRGKTYGMARERSTGLTGQYGKRVRWMANGRAKAPYGAVLKFASTSMSRVSSVWLNGSA